MMLWTNYLAVVEINYKYIQLNNLLYCTILMCLYLS